MLILEIVIFSAALIAVGLLAVQQIMHYNDLRLTNWQRFYLFRPACIAMLVSLL